MLDSFYLPQEAISFVNYPILRDEQTNIEKIVSYVLQVRESLTAYNSATANLVDINMDELEQHLALCRQTCESLGTAEKIPFDVLLELRSVLSTFYSLRTLYFDAGSSVIGVPVVENGEAAAV
ncbi:hypothetical protein [Paenibacillus durus]|uniref:Uncharacterized protein n=1 Tax=Paenibacillus durus ATCC 35681 TaxID=1333534 RepID=A0A0F7CJE5_PAEDU|nr:hypothetical protein [Paenibacillus durus]AKG36081.1 hypothetical protein VK70_17215 [Paenibacillus durus ATCC 35681]